MNKHGVDMVLVWGFLDGIDGNERVWEAHQRSNFQVFCRT